MTKTNNYRTNDTPIKKKFFISTTSIIAALIFLVIIFIITYNLFIYPMLHQDKIQLSQELYTNYKENIKSDFEDCNYIINLNLYIININLKNNNDFINLTINFFYKEKLIYEICKPINKNNIKFNESKFNLHINYDDILTIEYNYIYNRYNIIIVNDKIKFESRFKIKCSNTPFINSSSRYKILKKILLDKDHLYDNLFGINEYSRIEFNNKKKIISNGSLYNFLINKFNDEYLLINITNPHWIIFFIIIKNNKGKYGCYMIIQNQKNNKVVYCGFLNRKLKFFHSIDIELNIGSLINELKFKFYSENIIIDFNTNNITNNKINDNKLITSIDLNLQYNNELYQYNENIFICSNNKLDTFKDISIII